MHKGRKGEIQISEEGKYLFAFTSYKTFLFKLLMVETWRKKLQRERESFLFQITCLFQKKQFVKSHSVNLSTQHCILFFAENLNLKVEAL